MSKRRPPPLATWILSRLASAYCRDSFIGDLIEQYQLGRSVSWYWRQVGVAFGLSVIRLLRCAVSGKVAALLLRVAGESLAVTSLLSLLYESERASPSLNLLPPLTLATLALLCLLASALCNPSSKPQTSSAHLSLVKRLLTTFAAITLSAATLTWAGTTTRAVSHPTHAISSPAAR